MNELGNTPADKNYQPSGISKAEEAAQQYYDDNSICCSESLTKEIFIAGYEAAEKGLADKAKYSSGWDGFFYGKGYEQAEKDIIALIESIIEGIIGDAQPKPILRAELQELITKIKNED